MDGNNPQLPVTLEIRESLHQEIVKPVFFVEWDT